MMELPYILAIFLSLGSSDRAIEIDPTAAKKTTHSRQEVRGECTSVALDYFVGGKLRTTSSENCPDDEQAIGNSIQSTPNMRGNAGTGAR